MILKVNSARRERHWLTPHCESCEVRRKQACLPHLSGSTYSSKPRVESAQRRSSPLIVFRFSRRHLSLALEQPVS